MAEPAGIENPILNSPYESPARHFVIGAEGPTGETKQGRRPSESFIPVPVAKKGKKRKGEEDDTEQQAIDFDVTGERIEENTLINDIRRRVELWRAQGYNGVTPVTRKLLLHWADPTRENRVLFCQREAAETAIFLAEVAGRHGEADYRTRLEPENRRHNDGLPRIGLKMATGTGKTVVMAMLIAWQTANKAFSPRDSRFTNRFLIVTPGITIRDRLRVLLPNDDQNYYDERGLLPVDLRPTIDDAAIVITNYHAFLPRIAKEVQGVSATTRKLLRAGRPTTVDPFIETEEQVVDRVLRDLTSRGKGEIVVLNDEAHHCYQDKPIEDDLDADAKKEAKERNEGARVWFRGLRAVAKRVGVKAIYDLSATPFYLGGSGYQEGFIFPWVVSDFSLMDAIESGIVKVPRIPVDDDVDDTDQVTYLTLWEHVGTKLPKKATKKAQSDPNWTPPAELQGALESLYASYERRFVHWQAELQPLGEPPPVFIVVCPNTIVSKLLYDWIAGQEIELANGETALRTGNLPLLSNVVDGQWVERAPTIIVDSAQLESGEALKPEFKKAAAREIEVFKNEYRLRNPGADVDKLTDEDLLREVMNTVGKRGRLGEQVRCVVSVSMLTEGWDANTVTHILGIRRFGSQLLCEQVVGRGLRRRSYEPNEDGLFEPEYADVYGVPFAFIPAGPPPPERKPARPAVSVHALDDRWPLRITFPKVEGYRTEMPDERIEFNPENIEQLHIDQALVATWTQTQGAIGAADEQELERVKSARPQQVAYEIAADLLRRSYAGHDGALKPWLFPELVRVTKEWLLSDRVTFADDTPMGYLLLAQPMARAGEAVNHAVQVQLGNREQRLLPIYRRFDGEGSTDEVAFLTRKVVVPVEHSHLNYAVLDGGTNTWEHIVALELDRHPDVEALVKNDHLDFDIPYVYEGRSHRYVPDFLARLTPEDGDEVTRTLIVEVSGGQKSPGPTAVKAATARERWCTAVNNDGKFGRWGYLEITGMEMDRVPQVLTEAIAALRADAPIIGDPVT